MLSTGLVRSRGARAIVGVAALGVAAAGLWAAKRRRDAADVTFTRDVAPVVYARCAGCHRPGEAGPFDLLTYEDVADHAAQIADVTGSRYMPPWKPLPGFVAYANQRGLSDGEVDVFRRWVKGGAKRGDPAAMPPLPTWPAGWQLGDPDVTVRLPAKYVLSAEGRDVYRNFVIPSPIRGARWIAAWELRPGSRTVHHAILDVDRTGAARRREEEARARDGQPGYPGMGDTEGQSPDGFYLVWTPGKTPTPRADGSAWRLDEHTDLVLQLHMQPSGKPETIEPTVGLFFAQGPPTRPRLTLRIGDVPIDIPPGEPAYTIRDRLELPADVEIVSLFPHAHYLARKMRCWAELPSGARRWLLAIDDWDPAWQEEYVFEKPLALPGGTILAMEFSYDNSEANARNPSRPPRRVVVGEGSTDEMGNVTLQVVPRDAQGHAALRETKYRWELPRNGSARAHYNLANALADQGKVDAAIEAYRAAIARDGRLGAAHYNLANLLRDKGELATAEAEYREAVAIQPTCGARSNLGLTLARAGKVADARREYEAAIALDPRCAPALANLAHALAEAHDYAGAVEQFTRALAVQPDNAQAHVELGRALAALGKADEAASHYRRALAIQPGLAAAREALDALGPRGP